MRQHSVLVVDDEINVLNSIKRLLKRENYLLVTANSAKEALEELRQRSTALIITDQRMPGISGLELLTDVKKSYPETLRMIITGYADFETIVKAINEGEVYRFIPKPWNDEELKLIIRHALVQYDLLLDNKILLNMVKDQRKALTEVKNKFPDILKLPKIKKGVYVIENSDESLEDFMKRYFPKEKK